jgi:hypothetical protein
VGLFFGVTAFALVLGFGAGYVVRKRKRMRSRSYAGRDRRDLANKRHSPALSQAIALISAFNAR